MAEGNGNGKPKILVIGNEAEFLEKAKESLREMLEDCSDETRSPSSWDAQGRWCRSLQRGEQLLLNLEVNQKLLKLILLNKDIRKK